jgi:hypothetical protein
MYHGSPEALYDEMYGRFGIKPFILLAILAARNGRLVPQRHPSAEDLRV